MASPAPAAAPVGTGWLRLHLPGLLAAGAVAAVAWAAGTVLPRFVSEVLVAVLIGLLVANLVGLPKQTGPGLRLAVQRVLRLGIVLLGARLDLGEVARIGGRALGLVVVCMAVAFVFAILVGRALGLSPRLALLVGVGTAVCGNSAIVATAPVVRAEEREVSFAVATITLFGTLAVFAYPLIGHALGLADPVFGLWAGVAVNDTSQVTAAAAAYSRPALDVATVVKLVRNTLMAPLILGIAWWWSRSQAAVSGASAKKGALKAFPLFVLGFLAMALLRTLGVITRPVADGWLVPAVHACILVALSGVGLSTRVAQMRTVGAAPFYLGLGTAALLAGLSLFLITALGLGAALAPRP